MKYAPLMLVSATLLLAACGDKKEERQYVDLDKHFSLIDAEGRQAGTVLLRPIGRGEIRDNKGSLIGVISAPE